jgi:serine/threonine-protein kinase
MARPVKLLWNLPLPTSSREAAWKVFSDTDRFNRAAKLGFTFEEKLRKDGVVERHGSMSRFGMRIRWREDPFEYVAPEWFRSTRTFHNGPLKKAVTHMQLQTAEAGLQLRYEILLSPRNVLVRPIVALDAATQLKPTIARTLVGAVRQLEGAPTDWGLSVPALSAEVEAKLDALGELTSGTQLANLIRHGDLREQSRMRPLALAQRWELEADEVIDDFLVATKRGVLELRWDLLCPSCLGAKTRLKTLTLQPEESHCPSCNIRYDGSFPDSVEVTFQPAPGIREVAVPIDCILSPHRTPHVIAQGALPAGEEITWRGTLAPGAYQIDTHPFAQGRTSLEVRPGLRSSTIAIDLTSQGISPAMLRVGPGDVQVAIRSRIDEDVSIRIEQSWRDPDILTAGRLLEHEGARKYLSSLALPEELQLTKRAGAVMVIDARATPEAVASIVDRLNGVSTTAAATPGPDLLHSADGAIVAIYSDVKAAFIAGQSLIPGTRLTVAVDEGRVSVISEGKRKIPGGATVERAIRLGRFLGAGRMGVPLDALRNPKITAAIKALGIQVTRRPGAVVAWLGVPKVDPPAPKALSPLVANRYEIGEEIGRGGCGVVFAARDTRTHQDLVIKSLLPKWANNPSHAQRFYWEARIASSIDHPHTVRVLDYGSEEHMLWIAMERLDGEELLDRINAESRLDWPLAVKLTIGVLRGLQAAHEQGVVHRDIKPANIYLCKQPADHPKVIDFGIALNVDDELSEEEQDMIWGTPEYMSPEQVQAEVLDGRSDVYAVGLLLYEMLSGQIPFEADDPRVVAVQRLGTAPAPIDTLVEDLPDPLGQVVMRALAVDRDERWPDAKTMAAALAKLL